MIFCASLPMDVVILVSEISCHGFIWLGVNTQGRGCKWRLNVVKMDWIKNEIVITSEKRERERERGR